ncbi:uncharacterized protein LOC141896911 [Acropora palmata]|uniref:uncharacterized protein LOC141896911 n=1 Tax=Acropora palmata TaxID=6131 RepID=UPI003DA18127
MKSCLFKLCQNLFTFLDLDLDDLLSVCTATLSQPLGQAWSKRMTNLGQGWANVRCFPPKSSFSMHCTFSAQPCKMVSSNDMHCSNVEDASKQGHRLQHRVSKEKADLANLINFLPVDVMLNLMMYWPTSFPLDFMMKMKQHQCVLRNRCWKSVG